MDRRSFLGASTAALLGTRLPHVWRADRPVPSPAQLEWQRDELALFLHFGVNTFTDREWGDGTEDPTIFAPTNLDARQWARTARESGFRAMILTAKHHDGFCLWPTATTTHSVANSPFRGGQGDVVREFMDACRVEGVRAGLYLSPWDRNSPVYGDSERYNDFYCDQLTELLTRYGPIAEVWFDGANGEGPNGRRQVYDWPRFWGLVRQLQPNAVMFSDAGPDVRWCGNEKGVAGDPNWSTVNPDTVPYPGADSPKISAMLQHGDPNGTAWRPAEVDVSIRPGWFYHPAEDDKVRSVDNLTQLYFSSVGSNGKLLLNVPPSRDGVLHDVDVERLRGFQAQRSALMAEELTSGALRGWRVRDRGGLLQVELPKVRPVSVLRLEENIEHGQSVRGFVVQGQNPAGRFVTLSSGTTIGYARIEPVTPAVELKRVRVFIESVVDEQERVGLRLY